MNMAFPMSWLRKRRTDFLQSVDTLLVKYSHYSAIVIVSEDGLLFKIIQGLFQRHSVTFVSKNILLLLSFQKSYLRIDSPNPSKP